MLGRNLSASVIARPHSGRAGQAMACLDIGEGSLEGFIPILISSFLTLDF